MRHIILAIALAVTPMSICAQDFDKGLDAYEAGDYASAIQEQRPLADQGDAYAQFILGMGYANGQGFIQDNQTAHMWYNIASANGNQTTGGARDTPAAKMTSADFSEAQRRARVCMASDYQDCD